MKVYEVFGYDNRGYEIEDCIDARNREDAIWNFLVTNPGAEVDEVIEVSKETLQKWETYGAV